MANILIDRMPDTLTVDGLEYPIRTDYRACLRVMLAYEDDTLANQEKIFILLNNIYIGGNIPANISYQALIQANWFLDCGDTSEESVGQGRVYSFKQDADLIYAGFMQVHGIDLQEIDMHWWRFVSLFMAVIACQDTPFGALVTLRARVKSGKASKEEREAAAAIGKRFDLKEPETRSVSEIEAHREFLKLYNLGE